MYGPTETTIWSAVNKIEYENSPILIGRPINNTRFYIVDKFDQPVPVGVPGELLIGGYGVARGYLNRNKLTLEKFIPDKLNNNEEVLYRTGDLVKYNHAGKIYFLGRLDFQVKIRGFRIETGEIESVLNAHKAVNQAIVVASENSNSGKILSAYIIPEKDKYFSLSEIKDHLRKKLPDYMIPSKFIKMEKFPLNNSGKIDRKKLPVPDENYDLYEKQYVPPRDELDAQLKDIWEKSFGIKNIGINDDFFELGGHSLLAARIFTQIRKTLNKNLPLAALFRASTISKLSDQIKQENWIQSWDSLVPIKLSGTRPPLFLIHGAEGNILLYKALVKHLNEDQPVYGLQSPGLDGKSPILDDVKEMAQKYISEIKSIQPEGPYYLGGYCLGGTIAYEMARQLNQSGDEVGLVALIETCNIHNNNRRDITFLLKMLHKIENIIFQVRNIYKSRRKSRLHYFSEKLDVELNRFKVKLDILYSKLSSVIKSDSESEYRHLLMNKINDAAQNLYFPDEYNGKVLLFKPIRYFTGFNDNTLGWKNLITGELKVIEMTCYPRGSLNEPFVRILAEKLEGQLNKSTAKDYETVS